MQLQILQYGFYYFFPVGDCATMPIVLDFYMKDISIKDIFLLKTLKQTTSK
jgi:hypothetical protein